MAGPESQVVPASQVAPASQDPPPAGPPARPGGYPRQRVRRADLLAAARRLFSRKGYHATSVRDLADAVGLQAGSLYAHIAGKEDLLYTIVEEAAGQFFAAVEPVIRGPGAPADRLRRALRAHVRVITRNLDSATIFFHEWQFLGPKRREAVRRLRDRYEALWRDLIAEGIRAGVFREVDPGLAATFALSAPNWLYVWFSPGGPLTADDVADRFFEFLMGGMGEGTAWRNA